LLLKSARETEEYPENGTYKNLTPEELKQLNLERATSNARYKAYMIYTTVFANALIEPNLKTTSPLFDSMVLRNDQEFAEEYTSAFVNEMNRLGGSVFVTRMINELQYETICMLKF
jgi:hypothetical protein